MATALVDHQVYLDPGMTVTVRLRDGQRGRVLGRLAIAADGSMLEWVARPCSHCNGTTVVKLLFPKRDHYGPGKHKTYDPCQFCGGEGLEPVG